MEKTVGHSSGDHSAAFLGSGILGSTVAPAAVGVQYIPQPAAPMQPQMPISQGARPLFPLCSIKPCGVL